MADFVAIDFETANEKRDSACAIGLALVVDGEMVESKGYLIRPHEMRFERANVNIHGIDERDVVNAPTLEELWPTILEMLDGRLVVAHNASFDISVLRHSLYANKIDFPTFEYFCTYRLSQVAWPNLSSHSLAFLSAHHNIELEHHDAQSDAKAAAELVSLAGLDLATSCPLEITSHFNISLGELKSDGNWTPSNGIVKSANREAFEFDLPVDFDITTHVLYEKNVVITGKVDFCTREEAFSVIRLFGGIPKTSVGKKTDYLITGIQDLSVLATGETESSKLRKAKDLIQLGAPIRIITSKDFYEMLFPG